MSDLIHQRVADAISAFQTKTLVEASLGLFHALGYQSEKRVDLEGSPENFLRSFETRYLLNKEKAAYSDWKSVDFLFQLTDEEIVVLSSAQLSLSTGKVWHESIINSLVFLAIELRATDYNRSSLAAITREVNRLFPMPAILLFKYGSKLSLAVIHRRLHKRDESRDVLEKVVLIKDVEFASPHRAHIDILSDLAFMELGEKRSPSNFSEFYDLWQQALDAELLNKRFYRELANWYFWTVKKVRFPEVGQETDDVRNAVSVIRMITRLIFIWFIKEKGLVPEILFDEKKLRELLKSFEPEESSYYKAILQNLFFATLNTEMGQERRFRGKNKSGGRDAHYMIPNVYRYENYFKDSSSALKLFENIPFLNGGLFECLDKYTEGKGGIGCIRVDGFSDRSDNPLHVPNSLFFAEEIDIDLNDTYGTRGKRYRTQGLIRIFHKYKFTIDENTPIEEEIALDPELLGKVFENLLASYNPETSITARKQTGSFNTPRAIVDYMVDEALLYYLAQHLNNSGLRSEDNIARLGELIGYDNMLPQFSDVEVNVLIAAIDSIKVLDPACGSGAFPMGILLKLVHMLTKLDPGNTKWKERQIERVKAAEREAEKIEDARTREKTLHELELAVESIEDAFQRNELDYGRKLYLIENCIFGVDIQPIAVQIAKLRFFISLIVSEKLDNSRPNRGILPLPNLETKFVAANTLISIDRPKQQLLRDPSINEKERELNDVRKRYFIARTPTTKDKCRREDERLRKELAKLFEDDGITPAIARQLSSWDPYDQSIAGSYFDAEWMFGVPEGFDVIIGNPPYMRVQGLQQTQPKFVPYYRERYTSAQGNFDLYVVFVERALELMNKQGQLAFIMPHKFFQANFGSALRKMLSERKSLRKVVRFGSVQIFEEATTYTCLLFLTMLPNSKFELLEVMSLASGREVLDAARDRQKHPDYAREELEVPQDMKWEFSIGPAKKVLTRLQQHPQTLGGITRKIFVGLQTSADKIFVLPVLEEQGEMLRCYSKQLEREINIERGLVKPFLMGKDVHRYEPPRPGNVVIFPYEIRGGRPILMTQAEIKGNYPLGWKYLKTSKPALEARERGRMHGDQFYAYIYPKNLVEFNAIKIMTPEIAHGCQMTLDSDGTCYHTTKVYSFALNENAKGSIHYFLGLLNSKVLWFFLRQTGYVLRGGFYTFKTDYLKPFPIPEAAPRQQYAIKTLVEYVLYLKALPTSNTSRSAREVLMTAYYEQLIDGLVYELYFPEAFLALDQRLSGLLTAQALPTLHEIENNIKSGLEELFKRLYEPEGDVRRAVFFLDTIEAVRVIEEQSR